MSAPDGAVRITGVAAGGDGVGRLADGRAVFIPRTAPGDLVELADLRVRRSFGRATVGRLIESSPDRAAPACRHYDGDLCGGCTLQHLSYEAQLRVKAQIVRDALERIAKLRPGDVEIVGNPRPLGWRTRLSLAVDARSGVAGLHRIDRPGDVFALVRCEIASPGLQRLWDALGPQARLLPARAERLTLREDAAGGFHVVVHGALSWPNAAGVGAALAAAGVAATLWVWPDGGAARPVGGSTPGVSATVFEQVDPAMGDIVRRHAVAALGDVAGRRVWDLYAGTGETTALLTAAGAVVESVELDPEAVAAARRRDAPAGENAPAVRSAQAVPAPAVPERHAAAVEDRLPGLAGADLVIVNPPRSGLGPEVVDLLVERAPARIVYVSCDPATLGRDLARMSVRYDLVSVRAFDSFPQTSHVETVAVVALRG